MSKSTAFRHTGMSFGQSHESDLCSCGGRQGELGEQLQLLVGEAAVERRYQDHPQPPATARSLGVLVLTHCDAERFDGSRDLESAAHGGLPAFAVDTTAERHCWTCPGGSLMSPCTSSCKSAEKPLTYGKQPCSSSNPSFGMLLARPHTKPQRHTVAPCPRPRSQNPGAGLGRD